MSSEYGSLSYLWRSLQTSFWWNILQTLEVKVTLFHPLRSCLHERPSDPGAPRSIWKSQMDTKKRLVFQQNFRTRKYNYIIKIPQVFVRKISMAVSCKLSLSLSMPSMVFQNFPRPKKTNRRCGMPWPPWRPKCTVLGTEMCVIKGR